MDIVPDKSDIVLRTKEKEVLRFKGDGTFMISGQPGDERQIVEALRSWLAGAGRAPSEPGVPPPEVALTINTTQAMTVSKLPARSQAALESLKAALKEREAARTKTVGSVADLLYTFQRIMRPFFVELGGIAKSLGNESLGPMFNGGGYINTIVIENLFGLEWMSGEYITFHTGARKLTTPRELAEYLVDHHSGLDIETALNKVAIGVNEANEKIMKRLAAMDKIRQTAESACKTLKLEETKLLEAAKEAKALEGPKQ